MIRNGSFTCSRLPVEIAAGPSVFHLKSSVGCEAEEGPRAAFQAAVIKETEVLD